TVLLTAQIYPPLKTFIRSSLSRFRNQLALDAYKGKIRNSDRSVTTPRKKEQHPKSPKSQKVPEAPPAEEPQEAQQQPEHSEHPDSDHPSEQLEEEPESEEEFESEEEPLATMAGPSEKGKDPRREPEEEQKPAIDPMARELLDILSTSALAAKVKLPDIQVLTGENSTLQAFSEFQDAIEAHLRIQKIEDDVSKCDYVFLHTTKRARLHAKEYLKTCGNNPVYDDLMEHLKELIVSPLAVEDIYTRFQRVRQTYNGKTRPAAALATELKDLQLQLPANTYNDVALSHRFIDALDPKVRTAVRPHFTDGMKWDDVVALAARFDKVLHSEERRTSYKLRSAITRACNSGLSPPSPRPINSNNNSGPATQRPKFTKFTNELRQQLAKVGKC